jgi:hypothetical protein
MHGGLESLIDPAECIPKARSPRQSDLGMLLSEPVNGCRAVRFHFFLSGGSVLLLEEPCQHRPGFGVLDDRRDADFEQVAPFDSALED